MRALLIAANSERINIPPLPLGPACVAASAQRAGHEVVLLDLLFESDPAASLRRSIAGFQPEVVGVSVRNVDDQNMESPQFLLPTVKNVITACRSLCSAPVVLGGAGYSIFPEKLLRYLEADAGIQGEGEVAFAELLDELERGTSLEQMTSLYLPTRSAAVRSFETHLDRLPLPPPVPWTAPVARNPELWVPVQTRRGCPMDCSFCSTSLIEGRPVRRRSPALVARWISSLREAGCHNFCFVDSTFNLPPSYAKDLCRTLIEADLGLRLWCMIYPKWVDVELVELMQRAGCTQVSLGFESGSESVLANLNKHFGKEEVGRVSRMLQEAGIARYGFLLLGGPGETVQTVEESLALADSLCLDNLKITVGLRIYPQTPLAKTALKEGMIGPDDDLLTPRFYLAPGLSGWLRERVTEYKESRPWVA